MTFTAEQVEQLLRPINPRRVMKANNQSHVSQQDVRAHLSRIFGFGGWDKTILDLRCARDAMVSLPAREGRTAREVPAVTYVCTMRLVVWCPTRCCQKISEDVGTGTSPNLPTYGDAHDFAAKNAVSYALKRCAVDLGDQFGLSLYNKGQTDALVISTLVGGPQQEQRGDVEASVPQQVSLGDGEGDQSEPENSARRTDSDTLAELQQDIAASDDKPALTAVWNAKERAYHAGRLTDADNARLRLLWEAQRDLVAAVAKQTDAAQDVAA